MSEKPFLQEKYPDLPGSPEVKNAAYRQEAKTGQRVKGDPASQIEAYLNRLGKLILDPQKDQKRMDFDGSPRSRALFLIREMIMNKYVRSNADKKTEGAVRVEERAARDLGMGGLQYNEGQMNERQEILMKDLEKSLDSWISYLSDNNEPYPAWFRYYVFRNILNLGEYDKDKKEFKERSSGSAGLFPEIDRGALAYIQDMIEATKNEKTLKKLQEAQRIAANNNLKEGELITKEKTKAFSKMSFAKQYIEAIKLNGEITPELRAETRGKWVKYQQGTEPTALWASLQNKGTAWCTKGFATASTQLQGGDFYVYYTLDKNGEPSIPRIAIRMNGQNEIGEIRGVADNQQNLEGNMAPILEEKLKDFGSEGDKYKKKSADMKRVTELEVKIKNNQPLSKEDLIFLYEIDSKIEGFGYQRDPRIKELRSQRNTEQDMLIIFECTREQIAHQAKEINESTKAYVGKLEPGIFDLIQQYNIEHVYTSFPENRIYRENIIIGGKTAKALETEMRQKGIKITDYTQDMIRSRDFTTLKNPEEKSFVRLSVADLGFPKGATTEEIYQKAEELGLEFCPAETGPHYRLKYSDQPLNEWLYLGMKQILDRDGGPYVFWLGCIGGGLWLDGDWARPTGRWRSGGVFLFCLRKLES